MRVCLRFWQLLTWPHHKGLSKYSDFQLQSVVECTPNGYVGMVLAVLTWPVKDEGWSRVDLDWYHACLHISSFSLREEPSIPRLNRERDGNVLILAWSSCDFVRKNCTSAKFPMLNMWLRRRAVIPSCSANVILTTSYCTCLFLDS